MISDAELGEIEKAAQESAEHGALLIERLCAEVRRLRRMLQNHEDGTTKRELAIANLTSQVNELKRQRERMNERFMEAFNLPPEIQQKINENKLSHGKAVVKMTWTAKYGRVEYEVVEPE